VPADAECSTDDQGYLDRLFDQVVELIEDGGSVAEMDLERGREHLRARVDRMIRLAINVALGPASALPRIPGYTILGELGHGGMGSVYLARQEKLGGRPVALKMLPPAVAQSPQARARFRSEALAIAGLRHPHIVAVHDVVEEAGIYAYAMEWIDGHSLADLIEHLSGLDHEPGMDDVRAYLATPTRPEATSLPRFLCRIGVDLADALDAVHGQKLLHRDVKPSNVLLRRDGTALLSDFGLVRATDSTIMTQTGCFVGTPAYAAPEQLRGEQAGLDARSDVYSLGVTLYHALARRVPFPGHNTTQILRQIDDGLVTPLHRVNRRVPREVDTIVAKAMAREADRRYPSTAALRDDLKRFLADEPITARRTSIVYRLRKKLRRHRVATTLMVAVLILAVGLPLAWFGGLRQAVDAARPAPFGYLEPSGRCIAYETYRLQASGARAGDAFGQNVAIEGDTAVIGAHGDQVVARYAGAAYIYTFDGADWIEQRKLLPELRPRKGQGFGQTVAIDGDTMLIASPLSSEEQTSKGISVYRRSAGDWVRQAQLEPERPISGCYFGCDSIAHRGSLVAVGGTGPPPGRGIEELPTVWLFWCDDAGTPDEPLDDRWHQAARLEIPQRSNGWITVVALDGNTLVVGAPGAPVDEKTLPGAVYVFEKQPADATEWEHVTTITAEDGQPGDCFGRAVSLQDDRLAVGAKWSANPQYQSGGVYVFGRVAGAWRQEAKLVPSDPLRMSQFGLEVALRGDLLLIGAYDSRFAYLAGAVYVFRFDGWSWVEVAKLRPANIAPKSLFGWSIDVSGDTAIIGARHENQSAIGEVFVFRGLCDCNGNGELDLVDRVTATARDANRNGRLDECEPFPVRLVHNTTGAADEALFGPPDDVFVSLGTHTVEFDFGDSFVVDGEGPDLNVYELESGRIEFDLIDVQISEDGVAFVSVVPSDEPTTRIPGDGPRSADQYVKPYDLAGSGVARARYVRLVGLDNGYGGDGAGLELDAIGAIHFEE